MPPSLNKLFVLSKYKLYITTEITYISGRILPTKSTTGRVTKMKDKPHSLHWNAEIVTSDIRNTVREASHIWTLLEKQQMEEKFSFKKQNKTQVLDSRSTKPQTFLTEWFWLTDIRTHY
jgi:hypothetical protein